MSLDIAKKVKQIMSEQFGVNEEDINNSANLINDLNADSLDIVEFIMVCEDTFSIQIPDEDVEKLKTYSDVVSYIKMKTGDAALDSAS
jgi:acyl carrier protein